MTSCPKKKSDDANFLQDLRDHVDEFIHASMDEHKSCFKKTVQKMFGMSKIVAERASSQDGVESSLPLQTVSSKYPSWKMINEGPSSSATPHQAATKEPTKHPPLFKAVEFVLYDLSLFKPSPKSPKPIVPFSGDWYRHAAICFPLLGGDGRG